MHFPAQKISKPLSWLQMCVIFEIRFVSYPLPTNLEYRPLRQNQKQKMSSGASVIVATPTSLYNYKLLFKSLQQIPTNSIERQTTLNHGNYLTLVDVPCAYNDIFSAQQHKTISLKKAIQCAVKCHDIMFQTVFIFYTCFSKLDYRRWY